MSNTCFIVRSVPVFLMECNFSKKFFPMNTDACNVEDINIPQIKECLLLSCVASFEDWSSIFRTRSFTLCKNDLDFNGRSDSATVFGVHIIVINNKSVRVLCEQTRWLFINKSPRSQMLLSPWAQRYWTFISGFPQAFWCSRDKHVRSPFAASRDHIHHRLWFCCDSFFTCIFLCSLRHRFKTVDGTEMACWTNTKDDSIHHVWNFPLSVCLRVGSWCQCIWFRFWGPKWFYRTTNQEQLCGFWKHVSLSGASSLYNHLDHCFVVFKHNQKSFLTRRIDVWRNKINIVQIIDHSMRLLSFLNRVRCWTNFTLVRTQFSPCFITLIRVSKNCDDQIL